MMLLYDHPFSPYAQKVKIALREKGLEFQTALPGGLGAGGAAGEFVEANPRAEVPALIHDGFGIFDSTIILEYIEDLQPKPALLPATPAERARVRMLEDVMDTHYEAINWAISEIRAFRRAEGDAAQALLQAAGRQLDGFYAWLEKQLGDREWFNGDSFGWGDLAVVPYLNGSHGHGFKVKDGSKLAAWLARANARPSVAATAKEAVDMAKIAPMTSVADLVEKGLFKREYRDHRLEWMVRSGGIEVVLKGLERDNIRFSPEFH